jgi:putative hydrolase
MTINKRFKLDVHTHTIASGHAYSTIDENARFASENGIELLGMSEHAPAMPGSTHPLYFLNLKVIPSKLYGVDIMKGVELNIVDKSGKVDLKPNLIKRLDYAIASLHVPCIAPMDRDESTSTLLEVIKNPLINIVGHPCDPRYPLDIKAIVTAARDNNTLLEINNASLNPDSSRAGGEVDILELIKECKRQSLPIILGSDSHFYSYIGGFDNILPLLEEADMPDELIINTSPKAFRDFVALKNLYFH